jgi:excisionase family DNA binding protein
MLTVEEAAGVLRIGRGLAYELARRWEATEGREGIPVIRLGRLMRVPREQLEQIVGAPVEATGAPALERTSRRANGHSSSASDQPTLPFRS